MGSTVAVALARCWRGSTWRNHWRQPGGKVPSPVETTRCQLDTPPPTCCTWWLWSTKTPLLASTLANGLRPAWMLMNRLLKSFISTLEILRRYFETQSEECQTIVVQISLSGGMSTRVRKQITFLVHIICSLSNIWQYSFLLIIELSFMGHFHFYLWWFCKW